MGNIKHKQVAISNDYGMMVEVDELLAPLIKEMWNLGVTTNFSCQGDTHLFVDQDCYEAARHRAYIQMHRDAASLGFINELFSEEGGHFSDVMFSWSIEFSTDPQTHERRICIRFPQSDIPVLMREIEGWN